MNLFATALATVEKKDVMMLKLRSVIFTRDEKAFKTANEDFLEETIDVQVRINQVYRNLDDYYRNHWLSCTKI